jgi:hypothetical protein
MEGPALQSAMKVLLADALDIADELDNWAMRERVYSMHFALHSVLSDRTGLELDLNLSESDQTCVVATMGRFPAFQRTGWSLLEAAHSAPRTGGGS